MVRLTAAAGAGARPPISGFHVGAVVQGLTGDLYLGANLEFPGPALSATLHAEQAAIQNAWRCGETGLLALAVNASPCGYCRQYLNELEGADRLAVLVKPKGESAAVEPQPVALAKLLPDAFGPHDLGKSERLMQPREHRLVLTGGDGDPCAVAALAAANRCHAPYTSSFSGVALRTADGLLRCGSYSECAAYNPSLGPMQAALSALAVAGVAFAEIEEAVLVEVTGATASQAEVARAVLAAVSGVTLRVLPASARS
jgi:cytidine deaminase